MKYINVCTLFALSSFSMYAADGDIPTQNELTQLLLTSRTDQNYQKEQHNYIDSIKSIHSINLDNKQITDDTLRTLLAEACALVMLSAQHNRLQQPSPARCFCLTDIDFSNGTIETFSIGDWVTLCPQLAVIKLAHNKIRDTTSDNDATNRISCTICGPEYQRAWHSDTLKELDLSHNELTVFDLNILNNAPNLIKADFSHNNIAAVIVPKSLSDREQPCTVLLHHNQLSDTHKQLLQQKNSLYTKDYKNKVGNATFGAGFTGLVIGGFGAGIPVGNVIVHTLGVGMLGVLCGVMIGGGLVFGASACAIAHYCYPKNKRTYQPFALEFEPTEQEQDQLVVELDDQSQQ